MQMFLLSIEEKIKVKMRFNFVKLNHSKNTVIYRDSLNNIRKCFSIKLTKRDRGDYVTTFSREKLDANL